VPSDRVGVSRSLVYSQWSHVGVLTSPSVRVHVGCWIHVPASIADNNSGNKIKSLYADNHPRFSAAAPDGLRAAA
jgi:hypothetical protein